MVANALVVQGSLQHFTLRVGLREKELRERREMKDIRGRRVGKRQGRDKGGKGWKGKGRRGGEEGRERALASAPGSANAPYN